MPQNRYEDDSGPAASVYEDVHLIVFTLSSQCHAGLLISILFLLSSSHLPSSSSPLSKNSQPQRGGAWPGRRNRQARGPRLPAGELDPECGAGVPAAPASVPGSSTPGAVPASPQAQPLHGGALHLPVPRARLLLRRSWAPAILWLEDLFSSVISWSTQCYPKRPKRAV
jgi:hypothetical protein